MPTSPADAAMEAFKRAPQEVKPGYDFECNYIQAHGCRLFVVPVMERKRKKKRRKKPMSSCNIFTTLIELEESKFIE